MEAFRLIPVEPAPGRRFEKRTLFPPLPNATKKPP